MQSIILGGGCFWCLDALYRSVRGISTVSCGYAGGTMPEPSYEAVCTGNTGHAEVVKLSFDPSVISIKTILEVFWSVHDPTTLNRQGADEGTQYRSIVLYETEVQKGTIESVKSSMQQYWQNPIITEITQLDVFYPAEQYHQNYFENNPEQAYCQLVINPKLAHFKQQFAGLLS